MATPHSAITMDEVREVARIVEQRKKSTTVEEARARLIASGALDENGKPKVYPKVEAKRKARK